MNKQLKAVSEGAQVLWPKMSRQQITRLTKTHMRLLDEIGKLLAGQPSQIQGSVLADLTAIWLAGHRAGTQKASATLREGMLRLQTDAVRQLIPINLKIMENDLSLEEEP